MAVTHVALFPYPLPGHYIPLSTFAHSLASCDASIRVTLIHTEANLAKWQQQQGNFNENGDEMVQMVAIPDGLPSHFDRSANYEVFFVTIQQMGPALQRCLQELNADCPISCLVSDHNFPWVQDVANHLSLPLFLFLTDSAAAFSVFLRARRLFEDGCIGYGSMEHGERLVDDIPGVPTLPAKALPFPRPEVSEFFFQLRVGMLDRIGEVAGVLINTFCKLEEEALVGASRYLSKPVLAVGPCVPQFMVSGDGDRSNKCRRGGMTSGDETDEHVMRWLDAQAPSSVVYISFGSLAVAMGDRQAREIWEGLKASKQPFLWATPSQVVKTLVADSEKEEQQQQQQGRVVAWAPQQRVLSHPAVGVFMTHCGWNAALEGLSAGVPMLCCPQFLDQPLTSIMSVQLWGVGLQLAESGTPLQSEAVERMVRLILQEEEGKLLRQRASHLRQAAMESRRRFPPGSSVESMHSFIKLIQSPTSHVEA